MHFDSLVVHSLMLSSIMSCKPQKQPKRIGPEKRPFRKARLSVDSRIAKSLVKVTQARDSPLKCADTRKGIAVYVVPTSVANTHCGY